MATSMQMQKQFDALHRDAERVLTSINSLSHDMGREEKPANGAAVKQSAIAPSEGFKIDVAALRKRLDETREVVALRAKEMDHQVRSQPYPYIAGALGVGALAGWLLERRINH